MVLYNVVFFFFKQKTAYEMRISDWSSDVCSSDLEKTQPSQVVFITQQRAQIQDGDLALAGLLNPPRVLEFAQSATDGFGRGAQEGCQISATHRQAEALAVFLFRQTGQVLCQTLID